MSTVRLKFAFEPIIGGVWGDEPKGDSNDMVCVRVADFDDQAGKVATGKLTMRNISPSEQKGRVLQQGDLLLEKSGGGDQTSVGRSVLFDHGFTAVNSNFIALLRPRAGHDAKFLTYLMRGLYHGGGSIPHIKQTTGIQNLDCDSYLSRACDIPSLPEQQRIAGYLDDVTGRVDRLVASRRRQMELLREQRAALIEQAVTRGLDPNAPFKDSGLPWLGRIPKHWRIARLKHLCSHVVDCLHSTPDYDPEGEYPAIRTADVTPGHIDIDGAKRLSHKDYIAQVQRLVPEAGDIVYSREGERFGIAACVPEGVELCVSQRMMHFRVRHGANSHFVMWQLNTNPVYAQALADVFGSTSPHVNVETITNYFMTEPPFEEQIKIAEFIETEIAKLDALFSAYGRQLDLLMEYRAALIHERVIGQRTAVLAAQDERALSEAFPSESPRN
jgi:type I restriction enzyme S subunit